MPPSQFTDQMGKELADRTTEVAMCLAFVSGLEQGWKEGHEHGVIAAQFPEAWPKDEQKALATLPLKQLHASQAAITTDVPCIPRYVTIGQERDIVVNYIREQEKKGNFLIPSALTSRVVWQRSDGASFRNHYLSDCRTGTVTRGGSGQIGNAQGKT